MQGKENFNPSPSLIDRYWICVALEIIVYLLQYTVSIFTFKLMLMCISESCRLNMQQDPLHVCAPLLHEKLHTNLKSQ